MSDIDIGYPSLMAALRASTGIDLGKKLYIAPHNGEWRLMTWHKMHKRWSNVNEYREPPIYLVANAETVGDEWAAALGGGVI